MKTFHPLSLNDKISLKTTNGIDIFPISDIVHCYIENRDVKILLKNGVITKVFHSLTELESILAPVHFYRCHARNLLNLTHVSRYNHKTSTIELDNTTVIRVAFDRKTEFKQLIYSTLPPPSY